MGKKLTKDEFIQQANSIHNGKYDYSKVEYINSKEKVCIICPKHGEFWMIPNNHLRKHGCPKCKSEKIALSKRYNSNVFIKKAKNVHGNKFDYSNLEYIDSKTKVVIKCNVCKKEFKQTPRDHLQGYGCPYCGGTKKLSKDDFIKKAKKVHGDKYDYSNVEYINSKTKIKIICPEHGSFWQMPREHLQGKGCPHCNESKLEREVENLLLENNIRFETQKRFDWLGLQSLDFYLPDYNIAIECQGEQHFKPIKHFGDLDNFNKTVERDKVKRKLCNNNKIVIFYYTTLKNIAKVVLDKELYNQKSLLLNKSALKGIFKQFC